MIKKSVKHIYGTGPCSNFKMKVSPPTLLFIHVRSILCLLKQMLMRSLVIIPRNTSVSLLYKVPQRANVGLIRAESRRENGKSKSWFNKS